MKDIKKKIIGVDNNNYKLSLAKKLGCKFLINNSNKNYKKKIFNIFKQQADFCLEFAGYAKTIMDAFDMIKDESGTLFFASHPATKENIVINPFELIKGKKIFGCWGGFSKPDKDIKNISKIIRDDHKKFFEKYSKIYELDEIEKALIDLSKGRILRPILKLV